MCIQFISKASIAEPYRREDNATWIAKKKKKKNPKKKKKKESKKNKKIHDSQKQRNCKKKISKDLATLICFLVLN
jgi:hypothetical protein